MSKSPTGRGPTDRDWVSVAWLHCLPVVHDQSWSGCQYFVYARLLLISYLSLAPLDLFISSPFLQLITVISHFSCIISHHSLPLHRSSHCSLHYSSSHHPRSPILISPSCSPSLPLTVTYPVFLFSSLFLSLNCESLRHHSLEKHETAIPSTSSTPPRRAAHLTVRQAQSVNKLHWLGFFDKFATRPTTTTRGRTKQTTTNMSQAMRRKAKEKRMPLPLLIPH
jgi:hypothetical protein